MEKRLWLGGAACLIAVMLFSAAQGPVEAQQGKNSKPQLLPPKREQPYQLRPGDSIEVRFFFNPELNEQVQIRPDGRVSFQLIGEAELAGSSTEEATQRLETLFKKELSTPRISIQVRGYAEQKAYVTGEVYRPGMIPLVGEMSVHTALSEAGGIKPTGNRKSVALVRRGDDGRPVMYKLQLESGGQLTEQASAMLRPFDVIMVPETKVQHLNRWVNQYIKDMSPANLMIGFTYLRSSSAPVTQQTFPF
jgi:protein involved in polysaccharide export with SLBB domain